MGWCCRRLIDGWNFQYFEKKCVEYLATADNVCMIMRYASDNREQRTPNRREQMSQNTKVRYTISSHYGRFENVVVATLEEVGKVVAQKVSEDANLITGMFGLVDGTPDSIYVRRWANGWSTPISVYGDAVPSKSRREHMPELAGGN